jgi:hypothetical protein
VGTGPVPGWRGGGAPLGGGGGGGGGALLRSGPERGGRFRSFLTARKPRARAATAPTDEDAATTPGLVVFVFVGKDLAAADGVGDRVTPEAGGDIVGLVVAAEAGGGEIVGAGLIVGAEVSMGA